MKLIGHQTFMTCCLRFTNKQQKIENSIVNWSFGRNNFVLGLALILDGVLLPYYIHLDTYEYYLCLHVGFLWYLKYVQESDG